MSVRLGRISYVNMAPVFHRLNADVEEVQGVPTELNRMLLDGALDLAPISSIEYARHAGEGAAPTRPPRPARGGGRREAADRRRCAPERVRRPDAALRPRQALAR